MESLPEYWTLKLMLSLFVGSGITVRREMEFDELGVEGAME